MKTVSIAGPSFMRRCLPAPLRLLTLGMAFMASALIASAQTVQTIGGGPNSLPVTIDNSHGSENGLTRSGTDQNGQNPGARFYEPYALALDSTGTLYVADHLNHSIRKVTNPGNLSTSFTTTIVSGLNLPVDIKVDAGDTLYVLTQGDGTLRQYDSSGTLKATITTALVSPTAFTLDSSTNAYVTEAGGTLKQVTLAGAITTLSAGFSSPLGVTLFTTNSLAISDSHRVQFFSLTNNTVTLTVGSTTAGFSNGLAVNALFNTPHKLSTAPDGSVVVADRLNHRVRVIAPSGFVTTLYGAPTNQWAQPFVGWADGTNAHSRDPIGVVVAPNGTNVFTSEIAWNLLRSVGGVSFAVSTGTNTQVNTGVINSNLTSNLLTFGFQSGEGSSDFVGGGGGYYFAPLTLNLLPNQSIYSMGFTLGVTNETGPAIGIGNFSFDSLLQRPVGNGFFGRITNGFVTNFTIVVFTNENLTLTTNVVAQIANGVFTNTTQNILGVTWLELPGKTNLYPADVQDLVTFSSAYVHQFSKPNVLVGAFGFKVPAAAAVGDAYRIQVFNASASTDYTTLVPITTPTNGSLGAGFINSIKRVTVGIRPYLVGDVSSFRWYNAGDFGDGTLATDDAQQILMTGFYGHNVPPRNSDFFNAFDSSDGAVNADPNAPIDSVLFGDGELNVDDIFVTVRRSLDPYLKWYVRYWSNGVLNAAEVTNSLPKPTYGFNRPAVQLTTTGPTQPSTVTFKAGDAIATSQTVTIPITAEVGGSLPLKVLALRLSVVPLDGSPALTQPVNFQFTAGSSLGAPYFSANPSPTTYLGVWLNMSGYVPGLAPGTTTIGNLVITLPPNSPANAAYSVHFDHASASANGIALAKKAIADGLVTLTDRSSSSFADGIPDSWRLRHFGSLYNILSLADADADGDGIPNWAEYKAGTDPTDAQSAFRVRSVQKDAQSGTVAVRWPSVAGKTYQIEYADSPLSTVWTSAGVVIGTGGEMEYRDTNPAGGTRFYRVRLVDNTSGQ